LEDNIRDPKRQVEFIRYMMSLRLQKKLETLAREHKNADRMIVITPDILGVLQEMAILYAPDSEIGAFETEDDLDDFGRAVLIVSEMLHGGQENPSMSEVVLEVARQSSRVGRDTAWKFISRAMTQFELNKEDSSIDILWFKNEFERATGVDLKRYFYGGLISYMLEVTKSLEDIRKSWTALEPSSNPDKAKELINDFLSVRAASPSMISACIKEFEKLENPRRWTLIPIQKYPVIRFSNGHVFAIHPGGLAGSIFDGFYFAILDWYRRTLSGKQRQAAVEQLTSRYGVITEGYIAKFLSGHFGKQIIRLPVSNEVGRKRCDFVIIYPNKVILIEVKTSRFTAPKYFACQQIEELNHLLNEKIEIGEAITQLSHTIEDLCAVKIEDTRLSSIDWAKTTIIPVIISEENLPTVPFAWEELYSEFDAKLQALNLNVEKIALLRFLTPEELAYFSDIGSTIQLAHELQSWGEDSALRSNSFKNFLINRNYTLYAKEAKKGYAEACDQLAIELGFDWQSRNS
jgi:Holliday junction resolvase